MTPQLRDELLRQVALLSEDQQARVLAFVRSLAQVPANLSVKNISVKNMLKMAGSISETDLRGMTAVIEDGCERIDQSEW